MFKAIESHKSNLCEILFCVALVSTFLPLKVYPIIFILTSLFFWLDTPRPLRHRWVLFLSIFVAYASVMFLIGLPANTAALINFLKLLINFTFLYTAISWLSNRDNGALLRWVDITLHGILIITLVQLFVYHEAAGFRWLTNTPTSAQGSALYRPSLYFWGLDDKNMFGARIALLGFAYVLLPIVRRQSLVWWRIVFVLLLAWLSLSRTPVVALFIGIFCLLWVASTIRWRVVLGVVSLGALPFVAQKVIRIDSITASNDGMGVRLVYWKAFFEQFTTISPWGNGFMSGAGFLGQYARFYHGEPHIHNTFMSCYIDFGIIGLLSYVLFLFYFYRFCCQKQQSHVFWWVAFLPLLAIMMILYSGYDNDIILYLVLMFLFGSTHFVNFKHLKRGRM